MMEDEKQNFYAFLDAKQRYTAAQQELLAEAEAIRPHIERVQAAEARRMESWEAMRKACRAAFMIEMPPDDTTLIESAVAFVERMKGAQQ